MANAYAPLVYKPKPGSCTSDVGGSAEVSDDIRELGTGPYISWSDCESCKVLDKMKLLQI